VKEFDVDKFRIKDNHKVNLDTFDPNDTSGFDGTKSDAKELRDKLKEKLDELQELLYAEHKHKLLIVLQAMDTGGKDSTIRSIFEGVNPQGVHVASFKQPTLEELDHDFLWRVHRQVPAKGEIVIFNRSHYESVLVERVHKLAPQDIEERRYGEINDFERMLTNEGTTILKFYLHISVDEQKKRLKERLEDPTKEWKFSASDMPERELWPEYMLAYELMLQRTSTRDASWYVVPSNHKWFRDLIVVSTIVKTLENFHMTYPELSKEERESTKIE
jgi:PPK2 family polyphosphate:nucleotide phosphotransferase